MSDNTNVLEIKTIQIPPFRTLMTALKDILLETNIIFQQDGIRIVNMDKSHTILAHLFLQASKFEYYYCKYPKIVIGVNMFHLFKLINSIDNDDTLTIYIEENDYHDGIVSYLGLKFEMVILSSAKLKSLDLLNLTLMNLKSLMSPFHLLLIYHLLIFKKLFVIYDVFLTNLKLNLLEMNSFLNVLDNLLLLK